MMKRILTLLFILCATQMMAQKIDPMLTATVQQCKQTVANAKIRKAGGEHGMANGVDTTAIKNILEASFNADGTVSSFVVLAKITSMPASLPQGVSVMERIGCILIMKVEAEALGALAEVPEIERVEASRINKPCNEKMRVATSVAYVTGELPGYDVPTFGNNQQHYTGKDIVVGVVDGGIDFNHPAFRDPATGKTRVKEAVFFTNGSEKVVVSDENYIDTLTSVLEEGSHGTHTSATAAGSPVEGINARGVAYEADLVLCDCGNNLSYARVLSGINEVFEYAKSVGKPAVVNLSIGNNYGFHDGSNILTVGMSDLIGEGRIICVSAGNEADFGLSIAKKDSIKTLIMPVNADSEGKFVYERGLLMWINSDNRDFTVSLKVFDIQTGEISDLKTGDFKTEDSRDATEVLTTNTEVITNDGKRFCQGINTANHALYAQEPNKVLAVFVESSEENQPLYLIDMLAGPSEMLLGEADIPSLTGFDSGNGELSINTLACSDCVLSVGSYVHRPIFTDLKGGLRGSLKNINEGRIATYSSFGIDENGKARPDVLTPGIWMLSAYNLYDNRYFNGEGIPIDSVMVSFCFDATMGNYHRKATYGVMSGTSMACPVATGIVALWLQADPTLTVQRIREMLPDVCLNDKWTTVADSTPNRNLVQAGMGKLDALRGIKYIENAKAGQVLHPLDETITLANNIATYSSTKPLDFSSSTAPKAYSANAYVDETLNFYRGEIRIAENVGLLLTGEPGEYRVPIAGAGQQPTQNFLVSTSNGDVTLEQESMAYVLSKQDDKVGFYQNAADLIVPQGKAYLQLPADLANVRIRGFLFNEAVANDPTEIEDISLEDALRLSTIYLDNPLGVESLNATPDASSAKAYNICGQRVNASYKGIIIIDGRKYLNVK